MNDYSYTMQRMCGSRASEVFHIIMGISVAQLNKLLCVILCHTYLPTKHTSTLPTLS